MQHTQLHRVILPTYVDCIYVRIWTYTDNPKHGKTLLGVLDYVWLFPYAIAMFVRYVQTRMYDGHAYVLCTCIVYI